jgi:hypothetical protein
MLQPSSPRPGVQASATTQARMARCAPPLGVQRV